MFEARTAAQASGPNLTRTPSIVMQSYFSVKVLARLSMIANFLSSGQWALNSGVMQVFGRSSKSCEKGSGWLLRIVRIFNAARKASSKP